MQRLWKQIRALVAAAALAAASPGFVMLSHAAIKHQTAAAHHAAEQAAGVALTDCEKAGHVAGHTAAHVEETSAPHRAGAMHSHHHGPASDDPFACCDTKCCPPGALPVTIAAKLPASDYARQLDMLLPVLSGFDARGLERPPRSAAIG